MPTIPARNAPSTILDNWAEYRTKFVKVMPVEYRRALREMEQARTLQAAE